MGIDNLRLERSGRPAFDVVPPALRRKVHGVDYLLVRDGEGGEFYFTRDGWAMADSLAPRHWYQDERFHRVGRALPGATGSVYRVPVPHAARGSVGIVVKFCRFGQDVGLTTLGSDTAFPWPEDLMAEAEFLGPFEEFGAIHRLRERARSSPRIATKRPLAIHVPAARFSRWQLGRADYRLERQIRALEADQARVRHTERVSYDADRIYVMLYSWIEGIDAEQAAHAGVISSETMVELGREAARAVAAHGFAVLDHKPRHVIVRPLAGGGLLHRRGHTAFDTAFALIDYELLVPWDARMRKPGTTRAAGAASHISSA